MWSWNESVSSANSIHLGKSLAMMGMYNVKYAQKLLSHYTWLSHGWQKGNKRTGACTGWFLLFFFKRNPLADEGVQVSESCFRLINLSFFDFPHLVPLRFKNLMRDTLEQFNFSWHKTWEMFFFYFLFPWEGSIVP